MKKRLIIVDISSFIFRAFFAIRPMHAPDGTPVNSVYGTLSMLLKLINTYHPSHIVLARDLPGGSFRNEIYPEYKANRGAPPEELVPQFALIDELIEKMQIPQKAAETFEADDVIGAIATQFKKDFDEIYIASGDKDLMQFVDDKIKMLDTMKEKLYGPKEVYEKMGVHPEQIMDYLSLLGDSSDNIPGVRGIGAKGAAKLLEEYKTLDALIENIENISNKRAKTALENNVDMAHLSRELVEIKTDIDLGMKPDDLKFELTAHEDLIEYLDRLNFKTMKTKISTNQPTAASSKPENFIKFDLTTDEKKYNSIIEEIADFDQVFIEPFYDSDNYHDGTAPYCALAYGENIKIIKCEGLGGLDQVLSPLFDSKDITLIARDLRSIAYSAIRLEKELENSFDLTQAHFVLDADKKHDLQSMAQEFIYESIVDLKTLKKESFESEQSIRSFQFALAKRAWAGLRIYPWLYKKLKENNLFQIYYDLDMKLIPILSQMEYEGINLDSDYYSELEEEFTKQTDKIEKKIFKVAGEEVNLKSPKQVSKLLFETLELPIIKKTKTGASTDSSVLETLAATEDSEIPELILQYREIEKLNSTYVKAIPKLVVDGKIHTHFVQNVAATGRLSSEAPNLQNIPIRSENGRRLRKGFVANKGHYLLGADYSQVELRILAHFSEDPVMVKAFENDEDIHAQTAAEVFGFDLDDVDKEHRSYAKAINFGLMYGQSSFGLSQTLGISRTEAKDYITQYFKKFARVKSFLDTLKEECEKKGYSETLFGRRRYIKDINSSNRQVKSMAERMAINSPIQGTAADIIKLAMINLDHAIKEQGLESKLLLQVHDELIFEVPKDEIDVMQALVKEKMELAALLKVPLKVDMGYATNWYDLK